MKRYTLIGVGLSFFIISATVVDVLLSYIAFLDRPDYFIENEFNREIVGTFTQGSIPWGTILSTIGASIILALWLIPKWLNRNSAYPDTMYVFGKGMGIAIFCGGILHILGGLTWHLSFIGPIFFILQIFVICAICISFIGSVKNFYEEHKKIENIV